MVREEYRFVKCTKHDFLYEIKNDEAKNKCPECKKTYLKRLIILFLNANK